MSLQINFERDGYSAMFRLRSHVLRRDGSEAPVWDVVGYQTLWKPDGTAVQDPIIRKRDDPTVSCSWRVCLQ